MMGLLTQVTGSMNAGLIAIGACLMFSGLLAIAIREKTGVRSD
jgi:MFS-type transporter involved in bile tolerance (Atg22 family)